MKPLGDDAEVQAWKAQIADLKEQLGLAEGKLLEPKTEDEEKAELAQATDKLANQADINKRVR
jgi:hypothetical protein